MEKVLVVVDMQKDFVSGALGSPQAVAVVEPIARLIELYRENRWRIIYTADTHSAAEFEGKLSREGECIPRHCIKGEDGWQIVDELRPAPDEPVVEKESFGSLGLAGVIGPVGREVAIELCGVCTDICVVSNALSLRASFPANKITVLQDCCAGSSEHAHQSALAVMRSCLIDIM